jgi:hypothetical protein
MFRVNVPLPAPTFQSVPAPITLWGPGATTHTTAVTCNAHDPVGNQAAPIRFEVTVVGAHDQLAALESRVVAGRQLETAKRIALVSILQRADHSVRGGARGSANAQLAGFIVSIGKPRAPGLPARTRAQWTAAAAEIITVY